MPKQKISNRPDPDLNPGWYRRYEGDTPTDWFERSEDVSSSLSLVSQVVRRTDNGWVTHRTALLPNGGAAPVEAISPEEIEKLVGAIVD